MNEAETRAEHIDPALQAAGWGVVEGSRIRREYPITLGRLEGYGRRAKSLNRGAILGHILAQGREGLFFALLHVPISAVHEIHREL